VATPSRRTVTGSLAAAKHVLDEFTEAPISASKKVEPGGAVISLKTCSSDAAKELRQDPIGHHASEMNRRFASQPTAKSTALVHGHLFPAVVTSTARSDRVTEGSRVSSRFWDPNNAHPIQLVDTGRRCEAGRQSLPVEEGIDHNEVIMARPNLETQLADRQESP